MQIATIRQQGSEEIVVWGPIAREDLHSLLECCREVLAGDCSKIILDLQSATIDSSEFVGTIGELAMEARSLAKDFSLRACDRIADWLAWSGLQKIARLEVFSGSKVPAGCACEEYAGEDLP
jgi:hypothetical protein